MSEHFDFAPCELPPETRELRTQVRAFLERTLVDYSPQQRARTWTGFDAGFSRQLGAQGWIGMTWPKRYGGHERHPLERYVVIEELLAVGAPVAAHWIADRQSGPQILRFGSEAARERFIPAITRGELYCCIGMSEPDSGSDLASIRSSARKVDGGWILNGAKVWTTIVQHAHLMITLVRTGKDDNNRHAGLSQFIVDLNAPGVSRQAIVDHAGEEHFGEVHLNEVFVGDDMLLGQAGDGWAQVNAELALERSGPERYLSSFRLLEHYVALNRGTGGELEQNLVGALVAELWTLRQMSLSVAGKLAGGEAATLEAAMVKDLGACFEQHLPHAVQAALPREYDDTLADFLSYLTMAAPSFSLRGGTREILRGIISRGLGLR